MGGGKEGAGRRGAGVVCQKCVLPWLASVEWSGTWQRENGET